MVPLYPRWCYIEGSCAREERREDVVRICCVSAFLLWKRKKGRRERLEWNEGKRIRKEEDTKTRRLSRKKIKERRNKQESGRESWLKWSKGKEGRVNSLSLSLSLSHRIPHYNQAFIRILLGFLACLIATWIYSRYVTLTSLLFIFFYFSCGHFFTILMGWGECSLADWQMTPTCGQPSSCFTFYPWFKIYFSDNSLVDFNQ